MSVDAKQVEGKVRETFAQHVEGWRRYATTRRDGELATQPQKLVTVVYHELRAPNTVQGNFTFVLSELIILPLRARWTGSEVVMEDEEAQIADHVRNVEKGRLARLN